MDAGNKRETYALVAVAIVTGLTFLYTVLLGQPLRFWLVGWLSVVTTLLFLYLAWRLVRAAERIASAME